SCSLPPIFSPSPAARPPPSPRSARSITLHLPPRYSFHPFPLLRSEPSLSSARPRRRWICRPAHLRRASPTRPSRRRLRRAERTHERWRLLRRAARTSARRRLLRQGARTRWRRRRLRRAVHPHLRRCSKLGRRHCLHPRPPAPASGGRHRQLLQGG
ncbi:hypothetical protein BRADI_2g44864v3, partial [Brachypodium distachyon]